MTLDELLPWLFGRTSGPVRWGLERTEHLLATLGNPHLRFRTIHIGGTNGKGSVAALADSVLRKRPGRAVGLYTSPHLVSFSERIRVDGAPIQTELLLRIANRLRPEIESSAATFFEATTAIAFGCFAESGVDLAVIEVGLGGRLDATNVILPVAAAITNVDREHTELLGDSLEQIAREKAGILKPGIPAISAECRPDVQAVLRDCAAEVGAQLTMLDDVVRLDDLQSGTFGSRLAVDSAHWGRLALEIPLIGEFQVRNAMLAAELLAVLDAELRPTPNELAAGFASVSWPGRLQLHRERGTTWLLDVAHNPAGAAALCQALRSLELPRPLVLVVGVLSDKEWRRMLPPLLDRTDFAIFTTPPSAAPSRRWDPQSAAEALDPGGTRLRAIPDLGVALDRAVTMAPYGTIVVTGSIHTVGDAMVHLGISPVSAATS